MNVLNPVELIITHEAELAGIPLTEAESRYVAAKRIPRFGLPFDIGQVISFLLSPAAEWVLGVALDVDGG